MNNWNENEDKILMLSVKTNQCISNAFKEASEVTGRSISACSSRYYNVLKNDEHFCTLYVEKKSWWDKVTDKFIEWLLK